MSSNRVQNRPLSLNEILAELENNIDDPVPESIVFEPPDNANGNVTDEDSGEEDVVTLSNLPGSLLRAPAVANYGDHSSPDSDSEDDNLPLASISKRRRFDDQPPPLPPTTSNMDPHQSSSSTLPSTPLPSTSNVDPHQIQCSVPSSVSYQWRNRHRPNEFPVFEHVQGPKNEIFNWDKKTQGIILSSFFWGYLVAQIPAGLLAKRFGGKIITFVALFANGCCCMFLPILARLGGWPLVCMVRVVMGVTQACLFPGSHTMLARWVPSHERTSIAGFIYGGTQWGVILSLPLSGLVADVFGWEMIFYSIGGLLLVSSVIWWFFAASSASEHRMIRPEELAYIEKGLATTGAQKSLKAPWKAILTSKPQIAIVIAHFGSATYHTLFFVDLPTYYERALHISLKSSAFLSAIPYFGMWIGNIVAAFLSDKLVNEGYLSVKHCRKLFNSIGKFSVALGLLIVAFIPGSHYTAIIVVVAVALSIGGFLSAGFMINHLDISPNYAGLLLSLTNSAACFGSVITPIATSIILKNDPTDVGRWQYVFFTSAVITGLSSVVFLLFSTTDRQPWDNPEFMNKKDEFVDPEELKPVLENSPEKNESCDRIS